MKVICLNSKRTVEGVLKRLEDKLRQASSDDEKLILISAIADIRIKLCRLDSKEWKQREEWLSNENDKLIKKGAM